MRKILAVCIFANMLCYAQVGIGNNVNTFDDSEALKIVSSNKGVLLPNLEIKNLQNASPVTNPADYLLVYNTDTDTGKGFYYWKNNQWNPLLNTSNIYKYLGIVKSESVESTGIVTDNTTIGGISYQMNEGTATNQWQLIPGLSKTINIFSPNNEISVTASGLAQVNSAATESTYMSYSIALFVDNKLKGVRNFNISGRASCLYNDFNVFFNIENLSVGNHKVEIYETLRVNNISNQTIAFGQKHSACNNINAAIDKSLMNIQIVEK